MNQKHEKRVMRLLDSKRSRRIYLMGEPAEESMYDREAFMQGLDEHEEPAKAQSDVRANAGEGSLEAKGDKSLELTEQMRLLNEGSYTLFSYVIREKYRAKDRRNYLHICYSDSAFTALCSEPARIGERYSSSGKAIRSVYRWSSG